VNHADAAHLDALIRSAPEQTPALQCSMINLLDHERSDEQRWPEWEWLQPDLEALLALGPNVTVADEHGVVWRRRG